MQVGVGMLLPGMEVGAGTASGILTGVGTL